MKGIVIRLRPRRLAVLGLAIFFCAIFFVLAPKAVQTVTSPRKIPIYSVDTTENLTALGINCAWDNADIPRLIEILDHYGIKATFFVVGDWCRKYPEWVRALYDAGHEIGSHSDTHPDMTKLDAAGIQREIRDSAQKIESITGKRPNLFRPPSGAYNNLVIEIAEQEGFYPIQWDCDSIDYRNPTPEEMRERILKNLRPGSIMLFHSGAKNTPDALPLVIEAVMERGFSFVPVSQLIHTGPYTVDFEGRQHAA